MSTTDLCSQDQPSTSEQKASGNPCMEQFTRDSPATAQSVPTSLEAQSPPETASGEQVFFTTRMLNQASAAIEAGKFKTLMEWHTDWSRNGGMLSAEVPPPRPPPAPVEEAGGPSSIPMRSIKQELIEDEPRGTKRKQSDFLDEYPSPYSQPVKAPKMEPLSPKRNEVNPLKKLEMMTVSQEFNSSVADVVENGAKRDERAVKLEKLENIERQVEDQMMRDKEMLQANEFSAENKPIQSPYVPQDPSGMGPSMGPGPFSAGAYPPPMPGFGGPMGGPPGHFGPGGFPMYPGYPMSAPPNGKPMPGFPSPGGYPPVGPPGPMPIMTPYGPRMPPMMHPHHQQMYAQHMAAMQQRAAAGGPMSPRAQAYMMHMRRAGVSPHHPMMPAMPYPGMPPMGKGPPQKPPSFNYGPPSMTSPMGMCMPGPMPPGPMPPGPMPPGPMPPGHMPPGPMDPFANNGMLMVSQMNGSTETPMPQPQGWAPQLTPCYPPAFPTPAIKNSDKP